MLPSCSKVKTGSIAISVPVIGMGEQERRVMPDHFKSEVQKLHPFLLLTSHGQEFNQIAVYLHKIQLENVLSNCVAFAG